MFTKTKDFFAGIDSDGCVFDSMKIKHRECFGPQFVKCLGLEAIAEQALKAWEMVNVYSKSRGVNRFKALVQSLDYLRDNDFCGDYKSSIPELPDLRAWIHRERKLSNETLEIEIEKTGHDELAIILEWSKCVDIAVETNVRNVSIFPIVTECIEMTNNVADIVVVSQTPSNVIRREWEENNIYKYVTSVFSQETGTKVDQLARAIDNKYSSDKCIMIGDAWGDFEAASEAGILFYPINPGSEVQSWRRFLNEAFGKFIQGQYFGCYQNMLIEEFGNILP